jgi:hypothetical protein
VFGEGVRFMIDPFDLSVSISFYFPLLPTRFIFVGRRFGVPSFISSDLRVCPLATDVGMSLFRHFREHSRAFFLLIAM